MSVLENMKSKTNLHLLEINLKRQSIRWDSLFTTMSFDVRLLCDNEVVNTAINVSVRSSDNHFGCHVYQNQSEAKQAESLVLVNMLNGYENMDTAGEIFVDQIRTEIKSLFTVELRNTVNHLNKMVDQLEINQATEFSLPNEQADYL